MDKKLQEALEILRQEDKKYLTKVLKRKRHLLTYDFDFCGWFIGDKPARDFIYNYDNTWLNPKELEGTIDEIIEEEIFPVDETALEFISYYESKWGLEDLTEDKISSKIISDAEFHIFEHMGLCDEVVRQLRASGVEVKD